MKALSRVFRGKFLAALDEARQLGRLRQEPTLAGSAWPRLKAELLRHDWVVYAKQPLGGPAQVLEYLGRYTHRVAISVDRIVSAGDGQVAFRVRVGQPGEGKKRVVRLAGAEFIRRFLLHTLPAGFKRIRHYGLLGAAHKAERLAAAMSRQTALHQPCSVSLPEAPGFALRLTAPNTLSAPAPYRAGAGFCGVSPSSQSFGANRTPLAAPPAMRLALTTHPAALQSPNVSPP